jgi:hypothetical protein
MKPMKNKSAILSICCLVAVLTCSCTPDKTGFLDRNISNFDELRREFKEPSKEYGTIPFFVWNGKITREDIDLYMRDFKESGCGGVFIHARPGLETSYLTDEWHDLFRYTLDQGKKLGLNVWIYDEYNFPSGFAGGNVPAQMPESYNQGQGIMMKKAEMLKDDTTRYFLVLKEVDGNFSEVTDLKSEWGKKGNYRLFTKAWYYKGDNDYYFHGKWYGGFTYVDLLVPGVTEKFIKATMEGYEKWSGDEFGKFMPGIFTDEPHLNSPGGIRWTPDLFDVFQKQWGYDLKVNLTSLYEETGDWKRVRHNYAQTVLQLFIDRWAKPYYGYCRDKGLLLTGHYWEHSWPFIRLGPDNMAMYPWFQIPGIDCLFNQFNETSTNAQFGNVRSVKELASVANQFGLKRTLCETYGGGGWDLTFADMKRLGDWEYALGVNLMNQHMSPITQEGCRKYDHPPHFTYHEPWWKDYGQLNRYFARLSAALSSGKQVNDILVIEPTTSAWLYDSYNKPDPHTQEIGNSFQGFVTKLEKAQVEFDLGSENIIRENGKAENGKFIVGQRSYSRVVIPPMTENINASTFNILKSYVGLGGKLFLYSMPDKVDGAPSTQLTEFLGSKPENIIMLHDSVPHAFEHFSDNPTLKFDPVSGGNLYHHRRILDDGQLLFLANSTEEGTAEGALTVEGADALMLDGFTGQVMDYPETPEGQGRIRLTFKLPPAGSLLLFISGSKIKGIPPSDQPGPLVPVEASSSLAVERLRDNVLMMDFCDLVVKGETTKDMQVLDAADRAFNRNGFESGNPWGGLVQYNNSLLSRDTFSQGTGFTVIYHFRVGESFDFSGINAVIERPSIYKVKVNGQDVKRLEGKWWFDRKFGVFGIGGAVRPGDNELSLTVSPMDLHAEIEPAYITGNFSVIPAEKGWAIAAPPAGLGTGSWSTQGMPFYPYGMKYTKEFDIQDLSGYYEIGLGKWSGTVAEVTVNGKAAGIIGYPPYTLDVSKFIRKGKNEISVTVNGSLKNLLGPFHNNPPKGQSISPYWLNVKGYPAGSEYQIFDYGLMGDLRLYQGK